MSKCITCTDKKGPDASLLVHYITVESVTEVETASGDVDETWATLTTAYAQIEPLRGRELWMAQQMMSDITHMVTIRYQSGIDAGMRIVYGSRTFHIDGPPKNLDEKNEWLVMQCRELTELA